MKLFMTITMMLMVKVLSAQKDNLPYREIPAYAESYSAGAVASRMIDGLGFRYYWATEGLKETDLSYKPGADSRTTFETIEHIYGMSFVILNATLKKTNAPGQNKKASFAEMRRITLENLSQASTILRNSTEEQMQAYNAVFKKGDEVTNRPFWMLINGPIADCIWHSGQIVSFRRQSGNPFSDKVSLFTGTVNE